MFQKFLLILKTIGRKWFLIFVLIILLLFLINPEFAIWMTIITLILYLASFIPNLFFSNRLSRYIKKFNSIEDKSIAKKFNKPLRTIQEKIFELSQKQAKKNWVITYLNKQYYVYNEKVIKEFKKLYNKGFGEKEILESLRSLGIKTRAEVKAITDVLIKYEKLEEREKSVSAYREEQRFKD
ncbi:MAG: hypothetical protein EU548_04705 [Promethearchaeota archaeon]|nr:MAG: hypothetical protein EU548_04705 [Candidatus Lokiarchaeota archaeon]